jgi:hypothetical protein
MQDIRYKLKIILISKKKKKVILRYGRRKQLSILKNLPSFGIKRFEVLLVILLFC